MRSSQSASRLIPGVVQHNKSLLAAVSWSLRLKFCRIAASSKPRGSMTNGNGNDQQARLTRAQTERVGENVSLLALESSRKSSFAARGLVSCRIVAKRKSAKQRCRKLTYDQRLARPTPLRGVPEKYSGRMMRSSGRGSWIAACAHLALVKGVRQINANGWPTAKGVILARGLCNRKRGESLSGQILL